MKKILLLLLILCGMPALNSCRDLPLHGEFSGHWQIMTIDYPDGTTVEPHGTRYYCFYRSVAQLTAPGFVRVTGNLACNGERFTIQILNSKDSPEFMYPWGITVPQGVTELPADFVVGYTINHLSEEKLVMTTDMGVVISCRKF